MRVAVALFMAALLIAESADACRCIQRDLAEYFADADTVAVGRLLTTDDVGAERRLRFELPGPAYKGSASLNSGNELSVLTATSTASCGIQPQLSAIYFIFARQAEDGQLHVDSCSGTRIHLPADGLEAVGFADVPARFAIQQLNSLAGLDVLRDVAANAPQPDSPTNDKLIGLLDLAALAHGGHVSAYAEPDNSQPPVARISDYAGVENREYDYELPGAIVYAQLPSWYRLRLRGGSFAWVPAEGTGTFFPYPEVVINRLNYLTANWSGFVWPEPGAGLPHRDSRVATANIDDQFVEYAAEVHEVKVIGGMPFLRVTVLDGEPCSGAKPGTRMSGWVPAYGRNGKPSVWFWSRGC